MRFPNSYRAALAGPIATQGRDQTRDKGDGAMMQYLTSGADLAAIALLINRIALGAFFTISGFHKLFNPPASCGVCT
jgi:hypothetical protein